MITREYRLRITVIQQVFNRFLIDFQQVFQVVTSLRDFLVFTVYAITVAVEMSQPRLCSMSMQSCSHCSHIVITAIQSLQSYSHCSHAAMQPCSHSRHRDFLAPAAYAATAAMEMSQLYPIPMPMLMAMQPCSHDSHRDFSAPAACAATAVMEISQPYAHIHTHAYTHRYVIQVYSYRITINHYYSTISNQSISIIS